MDGLPDDSGAGDCWPAVSVDRQSSAAKTKMLRFTRISLGKSPVGRIQAQSEANVRRKKEEAGVRVSKEETAEGLAAELRLQHVNDGVLLGDDLSLPGQSDGHEAHGKNAERERQAHLCFRSGYTEYATHPGHKDSQER